MRITTNRRRFDVPERKYDVPQPKAKPIVAATITDEYLAGFAYEYGCRDVADEFIALRVAVRRLRGTKTFAELTERIGEALALAEPNDGAGRQPIERHRAI